VYLFHPDASGVSLCLSHGSTQIEGSAYVNRSDEEVAELMSWAAGVVGREFANDDSVRQGISLGSFDLAEGYERTTVFSKFYPRHSVPQDADLRADLVSFMRPLAKLYAAQESGAQPGAPSPDLVALEDEINRIAAPLKPPRGGQGTRLTAPLRKLVEYHAMKLAREWLKSEKFDFEDVSATDSCDFRAKRRGQDWIVEVKGTTGALGTVLLTRNEVALHRQEYPQNILLVVHDIMLSDDGLKVGGGELVAFAPWELDEDRLAPICFEYRLPVS
jgi:hypothetical protein